MTEQISMGALHKVSRFCEGLFFLLLLGSMGLLTSCQEAQPKHYVEKSTEVKPEPSQAMNAPFANGGMNPGVSTGKLMELSFTYVVPSSWRELSPSENKGMRARTFLTKDSLEATFVLLSGQGGGMIQNLDRWAKQLELNPTPTDMNVFRSTAEVWSTQSDWKAEFFDYRKFDSKAPESILAVVIPLSGETLFIKLMGPTAKISKELEQLKALVASIAQKGQA